MVARQAYPWGPKRWLHTLEDYMIYSRWTLQIRSFTKPTRICGNYIIGTSTHNKYGVCVSLPFMPQLITNVHGSQIMFDSNETLRWSNLLILPTKNDFIETMETCST